MEFCGVICEFNPFHNGHKYLIEQAKKITNQEIICLMSGDFTQRGEAAIVSKQTRAQTAIEMGANAVLEFPTVFACSNAENFAMGAIKIFKALGIKSLAFGIENTSLEILLEIAKLKAQNSKEFENSFKNEIENGINFNTALKRSIIKNLHLSETAAAINSPNNILAIEYLTAIIRQNAKITPIAINRIDNGFISTSPKENYLGATAIRELILSGKNANLYLPQSIDNSQIFGFVQKQTLNILQLLKIRGLSATELQTYYDYNEGIEYRIKKVCEISKNLETAKANIVSPRYRKPRVNKLLLYPLLGITKTVVKIASITKPVVKIIAISKNNKNLLKQFNSNKINLLASNSDYNNLSKKQLIITKIDDNADEIYRTIIEQEKNHKKIGTMFI